MSFLEGGPKKDQGLAVSHSEDISKQKTIALAAAIAAGSLALGCFLVPVFMTGLPAALVTGVYASGFATLSIAGIATILARYLK